MILARATAVKRSRVGFGPIAALVSATLALVLLAGCGGAPKPELHYAPGEPPAVRVGLALSVADARVGSSRHFTLADQQGVLYAGGAGEMVAVSVSNGGIAFHESGGRMVAAGRGPFWIRPDDHGREVQVGGSLYPGHLVVRRSAAGGFNVINVVDAETYLRGVVPAEIGHAGDYLEAAKAQAVAARTYLFRHLNQYPGEGFDVQAGVNDQVYAPVDRRHPDSDRAVRETRGWILTYEGEPIRANYGSTCGGETAEAREGFNLKEIPYLIAHKDNLAGAASCRTSRYFRWKVVWTGEELFRILSRTIPTVTGKPWRGRIVREVKVIERGASRRAITLRIKTDAAAYEVSRLAIRRALERPEGGLLRSTAFDLDVDRTDGRITRLTAKGRGWGHGVGMCQWGAMQLATEGYDFRLILDHYYPGTQFQKLY